MLLLYERKCNPHDGLQRKLSEVQSDFCKSGIVRHKERYLVLDETLFQSWLALLFSYQHYRPMIGYSLIKDFGSVAKCRIVTAPAEIRVQGAQSGAIKTKVFPRPLRGRIVAESITSSSIPSTQANMPEARKKLFHMSQTNARPADVISL